jgi:septal ring factor EnvC (AmiA/AmiB activator)
VEHQQADMSAILQGDAKSVESSLKALWDRARRAAEIIHALRENKKVLEQRVGELEAEVKKLEHELSKRERLLASATAAEEMAESKTRLVSNGEREALAARVKVLLSKIETYL